MLAFWFRRPRIAAIARFSRPQPATAILGSARRNLRALRRRVQYLEQIQSAVDAALPETAAQHVWVADYADGRLVLIVDSGSWATRIRYQQTELSRSLARQYRQVVDDLVIRVRPVSRVQPSPWPHRRLSPASRKSIADCGRGVADNPALAAALTRLASAGSDQT